MRAPSVIVAALCAVLAAGCGPIPETTLPDLSGKDEIRVVTTVGMIADAVANVGGSRVQVDGLMGPGVDPHLYKASEGDVRRLEQADVIFYGGLHLEAKMADVLERIGERRLTRAVTDGIPRSRLIAVGGGQHDPHVWFDVKLWEGGRCARSATRSRRPIRCTRTDTARVPPAIWPSSTRSTPRRATRVAVSRRTRA